MAQEFADKLNTIEEKWQEKWNKAKLFEVDPSEDDKFFITVAYPYPSGGMHIGHVRTFTLPDVFARFKRMQGKNVLFPMAWHVTGTPIIGALDRLKEGEEKQLSVLRDTYNVPEEVLESFEEPMDFANYFIENSYKKNMKRLGFSVDWRREFTTNDKKYNKFIEWQYNQLRDQELVEKGLHPTKYDLKSENPVTTHDLLEGENAERQEYSLVKFESEEAVFPCATLRPETVYGVTHILVNPSLSYRLAKVDGEKWVITEEAAEKLDHQDHEVEDLGTVKGEELIGQHVTNPVTGEEVLVLPADFIDSDSGTGVVMSVPAHAPYDWISLKDLKNSEDTLKQYGLDVQEVQSIEPETIINVEDYEGVPAEEACKKYGVNSQNDEEELEEATEEVYEKEFHTGTLNSNCGEFTGEKVNAVKQKLKEKFEKEDKFSSLYDFSEEVVSRSGGKVIVSLQESWFLKYSDQDWKEKVHRNLDSIDVVPGEKRDDYDHTIDWLEEWPCIRNYGLGTKLPFDKDFVVEPLSDSTIYMAYYTLSHLIEDLEPRKLDESLFNYVFQDEGDAETVSEATGISVEKVEELKESFDYWYPLDWRTSGEDLVQNHLTFMMYHHTALFEQENWPQGIATWGMGTLEGEKMSSSKGHVVLPDEAIEKYGADTTRFFLFASVEPWQDFDWRAEEVKDYRNKLRSFYNRNLELYNSTEKAELNNLDKYALSKLQKIIEQTTEGLESFQTRKAGLNAFFELNSLINQYEKRSSRLNEEVVEELVETQIRLMSPFTPHICEELWTEIGKEGFVTEAEWPTPDPQLINEEVEQAQELVENTVKDIREVSEIVGEFETVKVVVAEDWKRDLFKEIKELVEERPNFGEAMGRLIQGRKDKAESVKKYLQTYFDSPGDLPSKVFSEDREVEILEENKEFLSKEFDASIDIEKEETSNEDKASRAEPGKPAIVMN